MDSLLKSADNVQYSTWEKICAVPIFCKITFATGNSLPWSLSCVMLLVNTEDGKQIKSQSTKRGVWYFSINLYLKELKI